MLWAVGGVIKTEELLDALRTAGEAVKGLGRPVRIDTRGQLGMLVTGSGEMFQAAVALSFSSDDPLQIIVPSSVLVRALSHVSSPTCELRHDPNTQVLTLEEGSQRKIEVRAMEQTVVSSLRQTENPEVVGHLTASEVRKISEVSEAASASHDLRALGGVRFHGNTAQAANGFWAAETSISGLELEAIIPTEVVRAILKSHQDFEVLRAGTQVIFRSGRFEWISSTIEGTYPDLGRVFERQHIVSGEVNVPSLRAALNFAESLPGDTFELSFSASGGEVTSADAETGSIFSMFEAEASEPCCLSLNRRMLRLTIEMHRGSETVRFAADPTKWVRFESNESRQFVMLRRI
jgi:DNA polymerase III sliding clamp (beta) subunit (PCNA family)